MIRLKDIAARAGVSVMTVSKAVRRAGDVADETAARIRQLAEEMGYVPDALGRGLRTRRARLFGLVIPSFAQLFLGQTAAAIEDRAHDLGFELLTAQTQDNPQREELCIGRLLARRIDGLFVYPVHRLTPAVQVYEELHRSSTPAVLLGHLAPFCRGFANVEIDDASASCELTQHLIELGHERIAFFAGPPAASWAQQRFEGYRRALRNAQIPFDDRLVFTAGATAANGEKAAVQFLNESPDATAVQTASDFAAVGAAHVFFQQGLKIPRDLSLAGFGNDPASEHCRVPLSTVQPPNDELGFAAVDRMVQLIGGAQPETKSLPAQLILRASTGVPGQIALVGRRARSSANKRFAEGDDLE